MLPSQTNESAYLAFDLTVDTNAYAAGDLVGGKATINLPPWTLQPGAAFLIQSVGLVDQASQRAPIDFVFFNDDPVGTTFTENAALDIADNDLLKVAGFAALSTYAAFADNSFGQYVGPAIPVILARGATKLYAAGVCRGTPTYAATTDLRLRVGIIRA